MGLIGDLDYYEIEKSLFEGAIDVEELEDVWNEKYTQYLG